jgi:hypothetical protein
MPTIEKISIALPAEMLSLVHDSVEAGEYVSTSGGAARVDRSPDDKKPGVSVDRLERFVHGKCNKVSR